MIGLVIAVVLFGLLLIVVAAVALAWLTPAARIERVEEDRRAADQRIDAATRQALLAMRQTARQQRRDGQ